MEKIVGTALRKEREARGVSLADIARETRISVRFLQALEEEDFAVFPGRFYIHYYIKNYLSACGADDTAFFNTYQSYLQSLFKDESDLAPDQYMQKMAYLKFRRSQKILIAAVLLALLALALYLFLGPPRLLDRLAPKAGEKQTMALPSFSDYLLSRAPAYCLAGAPLTATLSFASSCWVRLLRGVTPVAEKVFHRGDTFALQGYQLTFIIEKPTAMSLSLNGREVSFLRRASEAVKLVVDPGNWREILQR